VLPGVDDESKYRRFAECFCRLQPVQTFDEDETGPARTMMGVVWPLTSMLSAMTFTRALSSIARRLTGT
jgi:hypothetical protein